MNNAHPPKPRFALSVGIIGHRPNRLPEEMCPRIGREIAETLAAIRVEAFAAHARHADCFSEFAPKLTLVAALAEGADRMAAEAALELGFELEAPLPFAVDEYEKDFDNQNARASFRGFLDKARAVLELDGDRMQAGKSYATGGLVVLDMSDLLIAVWDGGPPHGRGGTTELIAEAGRRGMPIIRVDATGKNLPRLHWRGLDDRHTTPMHIDDHPAAAVEEALATAIEAQIRPPQNPAERSGLDRFLVEGSRRLTARIEYPLLMFLLCVRWPRAGDILVPQPARLADELSATGSGASAITTAFGWADAIAVRFAQDFRSAVIANFLVSAVAVLVAALNFPYPWSAIELVLVTFLVVNALVGYKRRWHHRWIESREVAERLRVAAPMHALATRAPGPFGTAPTWPAWYARAISREAGLCRGRLDKEGLAAARRGLQALLNTQAAYHQTTAWRFRRLHGRLALAGLSLFVAAFLLSAGAFAGIALRLLSVTPDMQYWMIVASASLPAFASAGYGIRMIGDFDGAAKRSARMKAQLDALASSIGKGGAEFEWLRDRAHKASDVMLGDVAIWRLAVESRELEMPG
ncbi:MAG TPA: hypothetical protein VG274_01445 [Rhizomicrobium sp.]|nr:hypothetical protein [Rhizomicrobium sp.]